MLNKANIQWKGTDICMDFTCKCGSIVHCCGMFAFNVRCPVCKSLYECSDEIKLTKIHSTDMPILEGSCD